MNLKQHAFVNEFLYWNDAVQAYKVAYNSKSSYKTLESAANRLLKNPGVAAAIERSLTAIRSRVEEEVAQQLKVELLSTQEKRVILAQIVRGHMYIEQTYKGKNCSQCTMYIKPSFNIILRAIQEDSRLAGHYAPARVQIHNKPQQPNVSELVVSNEKTLILQQSEPLNTSPLQEDRGTICTEQTTEIHNKSQQKNHSLSINHGNQSSGQEQTTQIHNKTQQLARTISHAGLRKLLSRMPQKNHHAPGQVE